MRSLQRQLIPLCLGLSCCSAQDSAAPEAMSDPVEQGPSEVRGGIDVRRTTERPSPGYERPGERPGGGPPVPIGPANPNAPRIDLRVLVISANDPGTSMFKAALDEALVPYTEVDLTAANRPLLTADFLATGAANARHAKFQGVVLPNEAPPGLSDAERTALTQFEREFKIRQFDAYVYPSPAVGMSPPADSGYAGSFDGLTAVVTTAGKASTFGYLNGTVPIEDNDPKVAETYGYLAQPRPAEGGRSFVSFIEAPIPGGTARGSMLGVLQDNGREEMILSLTMNQYQLVQQLLMPGVLRWLTYGVYLGTEQNFLAVHIDDVFLPNARWDNANNCTVGGDCAESVTAPTIRMTPDDVDFLLSWQKRQGLKLDLAYNGFGYDDRTQNGGKDPLGDRLLASKTSLRWISHTYSHLYLGCEHDASVTPWRCATDAAGQIKWFPYQSIYDELTKNIAFATRHGIPIARDELVTGEHSGLRRAPQEPSDNPNLTKAVSDLRLAWIAADSSRETVQRSVGSALTVERYPMAIFYNTGKKSEAVDEYNWIYASAADGGSGACEQSGSTCVPALSLATGFDAYIVPREARTTLMHALGNDPRPHYAHQSNLAEDRILYPVLDKVVADYHRLFATSAPLVNASMSQLGLEQKRQRLWHQSRVNVSAYVQGGALVLEGRGDGIEAPLTVPGETRWTALSSYAGLRTGWQPVQTRRTERIPLPETVGYTRHARSGN